MRKIPSQDQVDAMFDSIIDRATKLRVQWRWAAPSIYDRPRRGSGPNPTSTKPPEDYQMKPHSKPPGSFSDPTGDTVEASESFRSRAARAGRCILDADTQLGTAMAELNDAMNALDPPPGPEVADVRLRPHPSSKVDHARAEAAQARRTRRASGSGNWDEVVGS